MNNCNNCKWWLPIPDESANYYGVEKGQYMCDFVDSIPSDGLVEIIANANDDSGLGVVMITSPYFGCKGFKEKEYYGQLC